MTYLKVLLPLVCLVSSTLTAQQNDEWRRRRIAELENWTKTELIERVVNLEARLQQGGQNGNGGHHSNYRNSAEINFETGIAYLFSRLNHSGFGDDGTMYWPDSSGVFYLRHAGFGDDKGIFYPNGKAVTLKHSGFGDHGTLYWPNGQILMLRRLGFSDDKTLYRPDGQVWVLKHSGYSDHNTRYGLPKSTFKEGNVSAEATLNSSNTDLESFRVRVVNEPENRTKDPKNFKEMRWMVEIKYDPTTGELKVTENY